MVRLGEVHPQYWDHAIDRLEIVLAKFEFQGDDVVFDWRKMANENMAERALDEKYGIFKYIALHPTTQYVMEHAKVYADKISLEFFIGEQMMPTATALILLFMLHKRISNDLLALVASFIFNVNPVYVISAVLLWRLSNNTRRFPKQYRDKLSKFEPNSGRLEFDHVLVGSDIGTLYAAALLSKLGHRCCVLQPKGFPSLEVITTALRDVSLLQCSLHCPPRLNRMALLVQ